jgi:GWxTD domain-containing protein
MIKNDIFVRMFFLVCLIYSLCGCFSLAHRTKDPYYESFYEKTRLLMTDEEKKIYQALPDAAARREFIEEFWKMRDPDPSTEENENKIEFENRIAFANEWFGNWKTFAGRSMGEGREKDRGWKTARGRVYIVLGPPSMVNYDVGWSPMRLYNDNRSSSETWYYRQYELYVSFYKNIPESWRRDHDGEKDKGEPYIREWDYELWPNTLLVYAMEDAKLNLINTEYRGDFIRAFHLKAEYDEGFLILRIPIDRVLFEERDGRLHSHLALKTTVYKNHKKIDADDEKKTYSFGEDEVLDMNEIVIKIPYPVTKRGNYLFDLVVTDLNSVYGAKYRAVIKKAIAAKRSSHQSPRPQDPYSNVGFSPRKED